MSDAPRLRRGDAKTLRIPVVNADGTAFDLTGTSEAIFALSRRLGAPTALEKRLSTAGVAIADMTGGLLEVALTPEDTAALRPGAYYFEVELQDAEGLPTTLEFEGDRIVIEADQIVAGT